MRIGCSLSANWLGDLALLKDVAVTLDEAGADYVSYGGHVLTAEPDRYADRPVTTYGVPFRDPFVLFSYLSALTSRLGFRTAILILPLYPTVLVAKQAADLSLISGGRFELGVGISWQAAEYEAFGQQLATRGRRLAEQLRVLRTMWREASVTFDGNEHHVDRLGIGQLPETRIPILVGCGASEPLLRRVARDADGWLPVGGLSSGEPAETLQRLAAEFGRDPSGIEISGRVVAQGSDPELWVADARRQEHYGASSLTIGPPPDSTPAGGLAALVQARDAIAAAL